MKSSDFLPLVAQLQTNQGALILVTTFMLLSMAGYYVYSDFQIRQRFKEQEIALSKHQELLGKIIEHFNDNEAMQKKQFIEITHGVFK